MRTLIPLLAVLTLSAQDRQLVPVSDVQVQRKMALVIGNSRYPSAALANPANDAKAVAAALQKLGFQVTRAFDLTRRDMDRTTTQFASSIRQGDLPLFYYSGHGVQVNNENYLVPIDFQAAEAVDIPYSAFSAAQIRDRLEASGARVRVIILDACRNNPFHGTRAINGGLASMNSNAAEGTLIAYATAENSTADDNSSEANGLYTKFLLQALATPGLTLKQTLERTRDNVWVNGGRRQHPFIYDGIVGDIALSGAPKVSSPSGAIDPAAEAWNLAKDGNHREMLEAIIREFPDSPYARLARVKLAGMSPDATELVKKGLAARDTHDFSTALASFRDAANAGNSQGMRYLGELYEYAQGVDLDFEEAMQWFRKGAAAGDIGSMSEIGGMYMDGKGVPRDYAAAMTWSRKAADAGDGNAMSTIGYLYSYGYGVALNYQEALRWFRKGADAGDGYSMEGLGLLYQDGHGVAKNYDEAIKWYRKGAQSADPHVRAANYRQLGLAYRDGQGVSKDYNEAMKWFRKAAGENDGTSMNLIGISYRFGWGVPADNAEALKWYRKADQLGRASAASNIAFMYRQGLGVSQDYGEAMKWYRRAVDEGDAAATNYIGQFYENGLGVPKDVQQALSWYQKGADAGDADSRKSLDRLKGRQ